MFGKNSKSTIFILLVLGAIQSSNSIPKPNPQNLGEIGVDVPTGNGGHRFLDLPTIQKMIQQFLGKLLGGAGGGGGARALNLGYGLGINM